VGKPSGSNPQIDFRGTNQQIRANRSDAKLQFSNDGSNWKSFGSGTGSGGGTNLLADFNFDFEDGTSLWTASGGSFTVESSSPLNGLQSGKFNASASSQTLSSAEYLIPAGFEGRKCQLHIPFYKYASGTAGDYNVKVLDGEDTVLLTAINFEVTGSTATSAIISAFDCPALNGANDSDKLKVVITSTANAGDLIVDDIFLGSGRSFFGQTQTNFSAAVSSADAVSQENVDWINGNCTNATTGKATCTFTSNIFTATPNCQVTGSSATDGRIATIESVSSSQIIVTTTDDAGALADIGFQLHCQKTNNPNTVEGNTYETLAQSWSGYHDAACSWGRTNAALGAPTDDATCSLVQKNNSNFGTVSTSGNVSPAIVFTPARVGRYYVCANVSLNTGTANADVVARLSDGTTTIYEGSSQLGSGDDSFMMAMSGI
jgi:hypothetical protein